MKKAFTLIEVIVTIAILGILSSGIFVTLKHLYLRTAQSRAVSELSFNSQIVVDQVAALLYNRVPSSTIGSNNGANFRPIEQIYTNGYNILEWIGVDVEAYNRGYYSGFVDLDASNKNTNTIVSYDMNETEINSLHVRKFGGVGSINSFEIGLVFSGSFDDSSLTASNDFNTSFGWYGNDHDLISYFTLNDNNITFAVNPSEIYERYYLVDSAYAIGRGEDLPNDCNTSGDLENDTLYLLYNFRPWLGQDLCDGNSTILSENVTAFQAGVINNNLYFSLSLTRKIRGSDNNITVSKQKVVF